MIKRLLLILAILLSCVGCDQTTKSVAKTYLSETESISLLGGGLRLQVAKNYGAFLSLGASLSPAWRNAILTGGVATALAGMFAFALAHRSRNLIVTPAIALAIGGGLSNLIDRLQHGGYVLDFMNIGIGSARTGIFNVADILILTGLFLLLFSERLWSVLSRVSNKSMQPTCEDARD